MTMLNHPWPLHDIDDVEAYVHAALHKILKSRNQHLDWARHEDAQQDLIVALWELSNTWQPTPTQRSFRRYASPLLGLRYIDWLRRTEGRTRWTFSQHAQINPGYAGRTVERERPELVALDDTHTTAEVDPTEHLPADLLRTLLEGDRPTTIPPHPEGRPASRRAA